MAALLTRVKSKLFIVAHRRTWGLLDGEYASVFRGRSLDYDDLREYIPGDEIRDIDWKATARHGAPLVKRYVATRKQTVLLLVDTGRSMAAMAPSGEPKKDIAIQIAGMLGYLAVRHGDLVGLISGDGESTRMLEPAAGRPTSSVCCGSSIARARLRLRPAGSLRNCTTSPSTSGDGCSSWQ